MSRSINILRGPWTDRVPSSWLDRIPFKLLFGVATSVELFQARLLKSTCQLLYGRQFDVEQADTIVEKIFQTAVAHVDAPLRIGPVSLQMILARQREQAAGIPVFVNSLKVSCPPHHPLLSLPADLVLTNLSTRTCATSIPTHSVYY